MKFEIEEKIDNIIEDYKDKIMDEFSKVLAENGFVKDEDDYHVDPDSGERFSLIVDISLWSSEETPDDKMIVEIWDSEGELHLDLPGDVGQDGPILATARFKDALLQELNDNLLVPGEPDTPDSPDPSIEETIKRIKPLTGLLPASPVL